MLAINPALLVLQFLEKVLVKGKQYYIAQC